MHVSWNTAVSNIRVHVWSLIFIRSFQFLLTSPQSIGHSCLQMESWTLHWHLGAWWSQFCLKALFKNHQITFSQIRWNKSSWKHSKYQILHYAARAHTHSAGQMSWMERAGAHVRKQRYLRYPTCCHLSGNNAQNVMQIGNIISILNRYINRISTEVIPGKKHNLNSCKFRLTGWVTANQAVLGWFFCAPEQVMPPKSSLFSAHY